MRVKKNNKGFSLIDVVCAAAILALVALPICSGFLTAAKSNQRIQTKTETINMLNNELSLILASGKVELDGGIAIDLGTVEYSGNDTFECKVADSGGNSHVETMSEYFEKQTASGEWFKITLKPKRALAEDTKVAYIEVTIEIYEIYDATQHENKVLGESKVSGVWAK